jgi:hypothetical protein
MLDGKPKQPIKAKQVGKGGRKHTLAPLSIGADGQPLFHFMCIKSGCGCNGYYTLGELIEAVEQFKKEVETGGIEKEDGRQEAA